MSDKRSQRARRMFDKAFDAIEKRDAARDADLISRLESAAEGSRGWSDEVLLALGWWQSSRGVWRGPDNIVAERRPDPTRSVDDALSLVPGRNEHGLEWRIKMERKPCGTWWAMLREHAKDGWDAMAATPALALCAAILRAKEAKP